MWLEGSGDASIGWVKAECDGLGVLVGRIESVLQIHEKCVTAPP